MQITVSKPDGKVMWVVKLVRECQGNDPCYSLFSDGNSVSDIWTRQQVAESIRDWKNRYNVA